MNLHLNDLSQTAWPVLADAAVKGAIVLAAAWTATAIMRRASAAARHLVWVLAVAAALMLPLLAAILPGWRVLPAWMGRDAVATTAAASPEIAPAPLALRAPAGLDLQGAESSPFRRDAEVRNAGDAFNSRASDPAVASATLRPPPSAPATPPTGTRWTWHSWMLIAWAAGSLSMLLTVVASLLSLWRLARRCRRIDTGSWLVLLRDAAGRMDLARPVTLLRGRPQAMPMTWGILRPKLLLPIDADQWPPDRRRVVLMHELAHIKRGDFLTRLLVHVARAVYWFNPFLWVAARQSAMESEGACDDLVLSKQTRASDYAEHLLTVAAGLKDGALLPSAAVAMARSSRLERRLLGILDPRRNRRTLTLAGTIVVIALSAAVLLPLAIARPADATGPTPAAPSSPASQPARDSAGPSPVVIATKDGKVQVADGDRQVVADRIEIERRATFKAIVVDTQTGKPIAGARLWNWQQKGIEGTSDNDGNIRIDNMPAGKFRFEVSADGYTRWWSEQAIERHQKKEIRQDLQRNFDYLEFNIAADMAPVKIELERGVRISGVVHDPDGKPVAGATVAPAHTGTANSITGDTRYSVPTGADGSFAVTLPASGDVKYNLVAHDGAHNQWRKWANGIAPPIQTRPGDELKGVTIKLTRPAIVRGSVKDETGKPLAGRDVRASAADKMENRYYDPVTRTDKDGNFELRFIRPGEQFIQAAPFFWTNVPEGGLTLKLKEGETNSFLVTLKEGDVREGVQLTAPASTKFPSHEEQLRMRLEMLERRAAEPKGEGADAGKGDTSRARTDDDLKVLPGTTEVLTLRGRFGYGMDRITDEGVRHLERYTKLRILKLGAFHLTDRALESIGKLHALEELHLDVNKITGEGLHHLAGLKKLRRLDLNSNPLRPEAFATLATLSSLTHLSAENTCPLDDQILEHCGKLKQLRELRLAYLTPKVTDRGVAHLASLKGLTNLSLRGAASVTDSGLMRLAECPNLRDLSISELRLVTADGLRFLGKLPELRHLHIASIPVDEQAIKAIGAMRNLEDLLLWNVGDKPIGLDPLGQLKSLRRLRTNLPVASGGVRALASIESLESIADQLTEITDEDLTHLARLPNLRSLELGSRRLTPAALETLAKMKSLRSLRVTADVPITPRQWNDLGRESLQQCLIQLIAAPYTPYYEPKNPGDAPRADADGKEAETERRRELGRAVPAPRPSPFEIEARNRFLEVEAFLRLSDDAQAKDFSRFYREIAPRHISGMAVMILSSYPEDILKPGAFAGPGGDYEARWVKQLQDAAASQTAEQVADQLQSRLMLNVASHVRTLQALREHPQQLAMLVKDDLDANELAAVKRGCVAVSTLGLADFADRVLALYLADTEFSPPAHTALVWLKPPSIVKPLLEAIEKDPRSVIRHGGLFQGPLRDRPAEPALVKLLDSADADVRYHAAYALYECTDPTLAQPVAKLAKDADPRLHEAALHLAMRLPENVFPMVRADLAPLLTSETPAVRLAAITAFAKRKDSLAGLPILAALKNDQVAPGDAVTIMQALGALADSTFGYNMHQWGPTANERALAGFERWLRERKP